MTYLENDEMACTICRKQFKLHSTKEIEECLKILLLRKIKKAEFMLEELSRTQVKGNT